MFDSIVAKLSQLAATSSSVKEIAQDNEENYEFLPFLSTELWVRIFRHLGRNDLDSCEWVCVKWHQMIRHNRKYFSGRQIDYIILSSKREFSMILSSGNLVKMYLFAKYFDYRNMRGTTNDTSFISVDTFRRKNLRNNKPSASDERERLEWYFEELRELTRNDRGLEESDSDKKECVNGVIGRPFYPYNTVKKTSYKISTPPNCFFIKLDRLLRNVSHVDFWVFQKFTITNAFVERFMHCVEPIIVSNAVQFNNCKRTKSDPEVLRFFSKVVLGEV